MSKLLLIAFSFLLLANYSSAKTEVIKFNLKFGIIKGGEALVTISDTSLSGKKALKYSLIGRTTGLTDKLFSVNDSYITYVDYYSRLPLKAIRDIKEKKYKSFTVALFYHDIDSIKSSKAGWMKSPDNVVDIISVFFYFIHKNLIGQLESGAKITYPTYHADKISDVTIKYMGVQLIETDLGKLNCYVLAPQVDKGKVLNRADGLKFFISKETKIPVLLEFDMRIGALKAELVSYKIDGVELSKL